jgi:hypothetical protein
MDTTEIVVLIGGVIATLFVLWYFFGERESNSAVVGNQAEHLSRRF